MRPLFSAFSAALLLLAPGLAVPADAAADPLTCAGYAERRQFVDAQAWWLNDPKRGFNGGDHGHAHMGACLPERERVSGRVPFDVRIVLHDNPGRLTYVSAGFKTRSTETTVARQYPSLTCHGGVGTCTFWFHFDLDINSFPASGLEEIRFRSTVQEKSPAGASQEMRPSLNFQVQVANAKPRSDVTRYAYLRGKGWYTGPKYCEASLLSPIPDRPLFGLWQPRILLDDHDGGGAGDAKVTRHTVTLDPDFHAEPENPGTVIRQGNDGLPASTLTIDTRTLANGPHKLHLRSDCDDPTQGSINSGVLVIPFTVDNP
jgi:hypothetical protein